MGEKIGRRWLNGVFVERQNKAEIQVQGAAQADV